MRYLIFPVLLFFILFFSCKEPQQPAPQTTAVFQPDEERQFAAFLDSLKNAGAADYAIINDIRKYLAARVDYGASKDSLSESYHQVAWDKFSGFHCMALFKQDYLTAECGLTSYVLAKLYSYAGYENFIYNCGYDGTEFSHQFNLVRIGDKLIVQDAFMDMTITNADGSPKDFIRTLQETKKGDFTNIKIAGEGIISEMWVDSVNKSFLATFCASEAYQQYIQTMAIENNRLKLSLTRSYDFLSGWTLNGARAQLKKDGLSENFLSLYLKPIGVINGNTGANSESLLNTITSVTGSGSPN